MLTDPLVEWMASHQTTLVDVVSMAVEMILLLYRPRLSVPVCMMTTMIMSRGRPERWLTVLRRGVALTVLRRGVANGGSEKNILYGTSAAAVLVALVVGSTLRRLRPKARS